MWIDKVIRRVKEKGDHGKRILSPVETGEKYKLEKWRIKA